MTDSQQQVVAQYLYDEYGQINNQSGTLEGYNEKKDPEKVKERGKAHLANLKNILG